MNCSFAGTCGNALKENPSLQIRRNVRTGMRGLVATTAISPGEILGEYLGHLQLVRARSKFDPVNEGYRLRLKTKTSGNQYVGIDALSLWGQAASSQPLMQP